MASNDLKLSIHTASKPESAPEPAPQATESPEEVFIPVSINEVMPSNKSTLADADGLFPVWVELYNYGAEPVNLAGYYLCCGGDRWPLPALNLEPGGYRVIFCSGDGIDDAHSNFTIPK